MRSIGNFDWSASDRFPGFTAPSEGYHGVVYTEVFGRNAFAVKARMEVVLFLLSCSLAD